MPCSECLAGRDKLQRIDAHSKTKGNFELGRSDFNYAFHKAPLPLATEETKL